VCDVCAEALHCTALMIDKAVLGSQVCMCALLLFEHCYSCLAPSIAHFHCHLPMQLVCSALSLNPGSQLQI